MVKGKEICLFFMYTEDSSKFLKDDQQSMMDWPSVYPGVQR